MTPATSTIVIIFLHLLGPWTKVPVSRTQAITGCTSEQRGKKHESAWQHHVVCKHDTSETPSAHERAYAGEVTNRTPWQPPTSMRRHGRFTSAWLRLSGATLCKRQKTGMTYEPQSRLDRTASLTRAGAGSGLPGIEAPHVHREPQAARRHSAMCVETEDVAWPARSGAGKTRTRVHWENA